MKAPGVVAPSLFPRGPSLLHSTRIGSARLMRQPHVTRCFLHSAKKRGRRRTKKKTHRAACSFSFLFFLIPPPVSFCFPVPKSNYRRTNFYSFLKAWDCVGEGAGFFISLFFYYFFCFSPSFSTSNQGCSIRASPFSTLLIFNSSCFALPLSYLMGGGGPRNPPRSSRCVCPPSLCPHPPPFAAAASRNRQEVARC